MKLLFFSGGERHLALESLLAHKNDVIGVITPYLTEKNSRFEQVVLTAIQYGIPVFPVKKDCIYKTIQKLEFDVLTSCGFPYLLDNKIISMAKYAINIHPTLLPKYRGFRSGPYVLINGEKRTGVTIHMLTEEMDQGDILLQESFEISPFDTTTSLYRKCRQIEGELLCKALELLRKNEVKWTKQNESEAIVIDKIRTPEDSIIDWNLPLRELYNEIRACDSERYPAYFNVNGEKVCIKLWRPNKGEEEKDMI